ncbi:uncharacterized protein LOC5519428 [Nematostella vectensis]|uniref:uncharacterized protein LOC5519428 n=1 Tax=Nematostella vectensis TaxID=45351 RepID=UPI00207716F3|nr:uncharacterized protein LOC5519428 [Nematostella vectensis]
MMKSAVFLTLLLLVSAFSVNEAKSKFKLCGSILTSLFAHICKDSAPKPPSSDAPQASVQDANSFLHHSKSRFRRGLHEECCNESCDMHEIYENC